MVIFELSNDVLKYREFDIAVNDWSYKSPSDQIYKNTVLPLFTNDEVVVMEKEWDSNFDQQDTFKTTIL